DADTGQALPDADEPGLGDSPGGVDAEGRQLDRNGRRTGLEVEGPGAPAHGGEARELERGVRQGNGADVGAVVPALQLRHCDGAGLVPAARDGLLDLAGALELELGLEVVRS